jgi:hypothetical protein
MNSIASSDRIPNYTSLFNISIFRILWILWISCTEAETMSLVYTERKETCETSMCAPYTPLSLNINPSHQPSSDHHSWLRRCERILWTHPLPRLPTPRPVSSRITLQDGGKLLFPLCRTWTKQIANRRLLLAHRFWTQSEWNVGDFWTPESFRTKVSTRLHSQSLAFSKEQPRSIRLVHQHFPEN